MEIPESFRDIHLSSQLAPFSWDILGNIPGNIPRLDRTQPLLTRVYSKVDAIPQNPTSLHPFFLKYLTPTTVGVERVGCLLSPQEVLPIRPRSQMETKPRQSILLFHMNHTQRKCRTDVALPAIYPDLKFLLFHQLDSSCAWLIKMLSL